MLYNGVVSHNGMIIHVLEEIEICCTMERQYRSALM